MDSGRKFGLCGKATPLKRQKRMRKAASGRQNGFGHCVPAPLVGEQGVAAAEGTDLYSTALEDYRTRNNLGFADAMDSRSDELNRQKVTASPAENTLGTWYGQQAQKLKNSYAEYSQPDDFTRPTSG